MHVPQWIVSLFDLQIENSDIESNLEDEFVDVCAAFKAKSLLISKGLCDYWNNVYTVTKYSKLVQWLRYFDLHFQVHIWLKLVLAMLMQS